MKQDKPWKKILDNLLPEFLAFYFPKAFADIDFARGFEFLEKELQQILQVGETGDRVVDKLVKVYLRDGSEEWLLIHIEVQGYVDEGFPFRVFTYNYRIRDRFDRDVISLVLLTDPDPKFRDNVFETERWDFGLHFHFPIVKLLDYKSRWQELEQDPNPFAMATMAFLKTLETEGDDQTRYSWKKQFLLELYRKGMTREMISALYEFVDTIMALPEEREDRLYYEIIQTKEEQQMSVLTTAARIGKAEGKVEGKAEGKAEGLQEAIQDIMEIKFGDAGSALFAQIANITDLETLQVIKVAVKQADTVQNAEKAIRRLSEGR